MRLGSLFGFKLKKTKIFPESNNLVLIGTVKNTSQFDVCFSEKFYYIPLSHLVPEALSSRNDLKRIKYVSIYQSKNQNGEKCGIRYIGNVRNVSVVRRNDITQIPKNSRSLYVLFELSLWEELEEPIKVVEKGIYPFKIVPFGIFKASKETPELYLESAEERELYRLLKKLAFDVNCKHFSFDGFDFYDENDNLIVLKDEECYLQLPMEVIREIPLSGIETLKNAIEFESESLRKQE